MKKYLFALTAILFGMFVLISCDDEEAIKGSTTFYGKVVVNPSAAKLNENVTFSIGEGGFSSDNVSVGISSSTTINGKDVIKSVSYFIDGTKVAESSDKANKYFVSYNVENISIGNHVVTAKCSSNFKNYTIEEHITQGGLIVEPWDFLDVKQAINNEEFKRILQILKIPMTDIENLISNIVICTSAYKSGLHSSFKIVMIEKKYKWF